MGMNMLEIHSGLKRGGKDLMSFLGENSQSKTMGKKKHFYSVIPKYQLLQSLESTDNSCMKSMTDLSKVSRFEMYKNL